MVPHCGFDLHFSDNATPYSCLQNPFGQRSLPRSKELDTTEQLTTAQPIYELEYHLAIKKNKIMPFAATWIDLEIILGEVSQRVYTNTHITESL